jgi:hypothetical protein
MGKGQSLCPLLVVVSCSSSQRKLQTRGAEGLESDRATVGVVVVERGKRTRKGASASRQDG